MTMPTCSVLFQVSILSLSVINVILFISGMALIQDDSHNFEVGDLPQFNSIKFLSIVSMLGL